MIDTKILIEKLKALDPQKVILFGSYAKGEITTESDFDILIIKRTRKKPSERIAEALQVVWGNVPHIEPLILTPKEFKRAIKENRFFITQEILKHGRVIYEKEN